jgi:hypothetical protein
VLVGVFVGRHVAVVLFGISSRIEQCVTLSLFGHACASARWVLGDTTGMCGPEFRVSTAFGMCSRILLKIRHWYVFTVFIEKSVIHWGLGKMPATRLPCVCGITTVVGTYLYEDRF